VAISPVCSAVISSRRRKNTNWDFTPRRWGRSTLALNRIARGDYLEREAFTTLLRGRLVAPRATENHTSRGNLLDDKPCVTTLSGEAQRGTMA
jgi:hypothetical protein